MIDVAISFKINVIIIIITKITWCIFPLGTVCKPRRPRLRMCQQGTSSSSHAMSMGCSILTDTDLKCPKLLNSYKECQSPTSWCGSASSASVVRARLTRRARTLEESGEIRFRSIIASIH